MKVVFSKCVVKSPKGTHIRNPRLSVAKPGGCVLS